MCIPCPVAAFQRWDKGMDGWMTDGWTNGGRDGGMDGLMYGGLLSALGSHLRGEACWEASLFPNPIP